MVAMKFSMPMQRLIVIAVSGAFAAVCLTGQVNGQTSHSTVNERAGMKIELKTGAVTATATLEDNASVRDLAGTLPLAITLEDYAATEKIAYLTRKLTTQGAPEGYHPRAGDIAYYAPWGNIAIFYKDGHYSVGLVKLGRINSGLEALARPGSMKATLAPVP